jgi:hypothetical protein
MLRFVKFSSAYCSLLSCMLLTDVTARSQNQTLPSAHIVFKSGSLDSPTQFVAFSRSDRYAALEGKGQVAIFNLVLQTEIRKIPTKADLNLALLSQPQQIAFDPNDQFVLVRDGKALDHRSVESCPIEFSSILYFQRKMTGSALSRWK